MKKLVKIFLIVLVFVGGLFAVSDSIYVPVKEKKWTKVYKTEPDFKLFKKVFPGVEFYIKYFSAAMEEPRKTYYGKYNGKYYNLLMEYSNLLYQVRKNSKATLFEKTKLLLQLFYLNNNFVDSISVSKFRKLEINDKEIISKSIVEWKFNYVTKLKIFKYNYRQVDNVNAYIKIKNGIIERIKLYDTKENVTYGEIVPLSIE